MAVSFAYPAWLLALIPLLMGVFWLARAPGHGIGFARAGALEALARSRTTWLARLPDLLRISVLLLIVFALARPRTAGSVVEDRTLGVPIVIAIDLSSSMLARDMEAGVTRLAVAKQTISRFIAGRSGDPIGLVAFAADALTVVPLTTQRRVLVSALAGLQVGLLEDGTAVGEGLATAANRLRRAPGESRVVILMTDGESNRGVIDPLVAAQAAAAFGIRVFTISVGSNPAGADDDLLTGIASTTGGEFFQASDARALENIYRRIDSLVQVPLRTRTYVEYMEWHLPLILLACALFGVEWILRGSRWGTVP